MKKIRTIPELIRSLERCSEGAKGVLEVMLNLEIPREEFEQYYTWNTDRYSRNVLARDNNFEALLICWEKGQTSPIHDFNAQEAWIHPVEGKLREERFILNKEKGKLEKVSSVLLGKSEFSYMSQIGIHRYSNEYDGRSVTLNIYRKPVAEWHVYYNEESSYCTRVEIWENKNYDLLQLK